MSELTVLGAIFLSALLHAGWNALLKRAEDPPAASALIVALACVVTTGLALILGPAEVPTAAWPALLTVGAIEGLYFVTLSSALRALPLGTAYGISRGAGLLLVWPLSVVYFGEAIDGRALAGAVLLSLGLFALMERTRAWRGLGLALACALTIAAYPLAYKRALALGVSPFPLFAIALALSLPIQLVALRDRRSRLAIALRASPVRTALGGLLCAASFLLFLVALEHGGAGRITALRNSSVLFATVFGWMAGEPRTRRSALSALAVAVGAVLLTS